MAKDKKKARQPKALIQVLGDWIRVGKDRNVNACGVDAYWASQSLLTKVVVSGITMDVPCSELRFRKAMNAALGLTTKDTVEIS